jgi:transposase
MTVFDNVKQMKNVGRDEKRMWRVDNNAPVRFAEELIFEGFGMMMLTEIERHSGAGRPREYPDSMVIWGMKIMTTFKQGYRLTVGVMRGILKRTGIVCISVSQFYHRAKEIFSSGTSKEITDARILAVGVGQVTPSERRITLAVDSTGVRPSSAGEWLSKARNDKNVTGWIKFHIAVNVDTNEILAFVVTTEECGDNTCFMLLLNTVLDAGHEIGTIYADTSYDAKDNWRLTYTGIRFISNIKTNSIGKFRGCAPRGLQALRRGEIGEREWKIEVGYGRRWKVECTFSDFKRMLAETLRSRERKMMAAELYWKVLTFDQYKGMRKELSGAV